jgi:hypothetical protein
MFRETSKMRQPGGGEVVRNRDLWRSEPGAGAIRHPCVQIEEGAGVSAFPGGEPLLIRRGGYGAVAAEADGVAGSVFTVAVLEVEAVGES